MQVNADAPYGHPLLVLAQTVQPRRIFGMADDATGHQTFDSCEPFAPPFLFWVSQLRLMLMPRIVIRCLF